MVLIRDVGQVEARFGLFGDSVKLNATSVCGLCRTYHRLRNHFGGTKWNSYVMWDIWNLVSVRLETVSVGAR